MSPQPRDSRPPGVAAGLKSSGKRDLALVQNRGPLTAAAGVFTTNRVQGQPGRCGASRSSRTAWSRAIVLNSGGANCYTGAQGFQTTHATAEAVAARSEVSAGDVLVCSTGLIGDQLDLDKLPPGSTTAAGALASRRRAGRRRPRS